MIEMSWAQARHLRYMEAMMCVLFGWLSAARRRRRQRPCCAQLILAGKAES